MTSRRTPGAAVETVLSAAQTGLSILLPRVSPDGRFLLFCMSQYGCFPVYQPTSDLYLMDLQTGKYRKASVNSEYAESWHSWSSNSRWIVFSSKRQGGLFTRPFLSYVDANGETHKPFVLPQKHPSFYESCYRVYSVPELIAGPVTVDSEALVQSHRQSHTDRRQFRHRRHPQNRTAPRPTRKAGPAYSSTAFRKSWD